MEEGHGLVQIYCKNSLTVRNTIWEHHLEVPIGFWLLSH